MDSRDLIIARLRGKMSSSLREPMLPPPEEIFADLAPRGDLLTTFVERLSLLRGKVRTAASAVEAGAALLELVQGRNAFAVQGRYLSAVLRATPGLENKFTVMNENSLAEISNSGLAAFEVGITEADAFIARTGSVAISNFDRRISLFPAHHIVIGQVDQIQPTLSDWLTSLAVHASWSSATLITGPSRTADIEKILVLGAHGPKELSVVMIK